MNRPQLLSIPRDKAMKTKTTKTTKTTKPSAPATPAPAPAAPQNAFNPDFLDYLHGHANIALFDWLKDNAPPAVRTLHQSLFSLQEGERQMRETGSIDPICFDIREVILETLSALCELGAEFSDGYTIMAIQPTGKDGANHPLGVAK